MNILGITPARGGCKGVLSKNIKEIAGKPLIAWAIEVANESKMIDRYVVSTEDKIKAMECYEKESRCFPHSRSSEGLIINAKKRGTEIGMAAAEAFMILRDKWV